jgi:hypothetical protein
MKKNWKNYDSVISRTIYIYYLERAAEFRYLLYHYKKCTELGERRSLRKRKQELILILDKAININKISLSTLGIPYTELKNYPNLLEIKRKEQYLKRSIA